jgi:hypothetical protein
VYLSVNHGPLGHRSPLGLKCEPGQNLKAGHVPGHMLGSQSGEGNLRLEGKSGDKRLSTAT